MRSPKIILSILGLCALVQPVSSQAPAPGKHIVIAASELLDGKGHVLRDSRVVIEGARIVAIDPKAGPVDYDLRHLTVLPGWIDAHVHITWSFGPDGKNAGQGGTTPEAAGCPRSRCFCETWELTLRMGLGQAVSASPTGGAPPVSHVPGRKGGRNTLVLTGLVSPSLRRDSVTEALVLRGGHRRGFARLLWSSARIPGLAKAARPGAPGTRAVSSPDSPKCRGSYKKKRSKRAIYASQRARRIARPAQITAQRALVQDDNPN